MRPATGLKLARPLTPPAAARKIKEDFPMHAQIVYMTAGDLAEARRIGRTLVEERLAACVNIIDGMRAVYRWEGELQEGQEVVVIAKTVAAKVDALVARVKALHSYECCCVLALPVAAGNSPFLDWIAAEVAP
jgi:periplasmic divalent cation tolerance protein